MTEEAAISLQRATDRALMQQRSQVAASHSWEQVVRRTQQHASYGGVPGWNAWSRPTTGRRARSATNGPRDWKGDLVLTESFQSIVDRDDAGETVNLLEYWDSQPCECSYLEDEDSSVRASAEGKCKSAYGDESGLKTLTCTKKPSWNGVSCSCKYTCDPPSDCGAFTSFAQVLLDDIMPCYEADNPGAGSVESVVTSGASWCLVQFLCPDNTTPTATVTRALYEEDIAEAKEEAAEEKDYGEELSCGWSPFSDKAPVDRIDFGDRVDEAGLRDWGVPVPEVEWKNNTPFAGCVINQSNESVLVHQCGATAADTITETLAAGTDNCAIFRADWDFVTVDDTIYKIKPFIAIVQADRSVANACVTTAMCKDC